MNTKMLRAVLGLCLITVAGGGCVTIDGDGSAGGGDPGNGATGSGVPSGGARICVDESCDGNDPDPGACFDVLAVVYEPRSTGGSPQCQGFDPGRCKVTQDGCSVTIESSVYGSHTVTVDASGRTDATQVVIGDGYVASCSFEFGSDWMTTKCIAAGVTCEFGEWIPPSG